jgi:hypothetical protein
MALIAARPEGGGRGRSWRAARWLSFLPWTQPIPSSRFTTACSARKGLTLRFIPAVCNKTQVALQAERLLTSNPAEISLRCVPVVHHCLENREGRGCHAQHHLDLIMPDRNAGLVPNEKHATHLQRHALVTLRHASLTMRARVRGR